MSNLFILPKPALVVKVLTNRRANIMFSAFFHIWDFLAVLCCNPSGCDMKLASVIG